jgi:hypothetical protein
MNCKRAEKYISRAVDGLSTNEEEKSLKRHIESCGRCQKLEKSYTFIVESLKIKDYPETQPYFWERLKPKLKARKQYDPWFIWKKWSLRAIPLSIVAVIFLALGFTLFPPQPKAELSQSEVLLLRNQDPFQETRNLLDEEGIEKKNMMLIFASLDEQNGLRRYLP